LPERESLSHELIPQHKLLPKEAGEKLLAEFRVTRLQIPKIMVKDAALAGTGAKAGQIVEVTRLDGSKNYRLVIE
jgi:DNA-directed RNA polymerase subunit H (RpoH/RPB5)